MNFLRLYILWHDLPHDVNNQEIPNARMISWVMSVNRSHCVVKEHCSIPDKNWYSYKHHKSGGEYKIGVHLFESIFVLISGPHQAGEIDLIII